MPKQRRASSPGIPRDNSKKKQRNPRDPASSTKSRPAAQHAQSARSSSPPQGISLEPEDSFVARRSSASARRSELIAHLVEVVLPHLKITVQDLKDGGVTETQRKAIFIEMYREFGAWRAGAKVLGLGRGDIQTWREEDEVFKRTMDDAWQDAIDDNELEARRRAIEGNEIVEVVESEGTNAHGAYSNKTTKRRAEYSDTLLMFLLRGQRPEKYGTRNIVSGPDGGPVQVTKVERVMVAPKPMGGDK